MNGGIVALSREQVTTMAHLWKRKQSPFGEGFGGSVQNPGSLCKWNLGAQRKSCPSLTACSVLTHGCQQTHNWGPRAHGICAVA